MDINDNVFVITGGGNGIGRELTLNLLSKGGRVAAVDIDQAGMDETAQLAGTAAERLSNHRVDITDRAAVAALPEAVLTAHGQVDGLINNAGIIQPFVKINSLDFSAIDRVMNINFNGTINMTKAFLPELLKRPAAQVVNISSMGGFLPVPGQGVYGASQAAIKLLSEAMYAELINTGVRVSTVFPGAIATEIAARSGLDIAAMQGDVSAESKFTPMPANQAAEIIVDGMMKERFHILVGSDAKFMNFLFRLAPKFATNYITKQMGSLLKE
jgi:short-subunit dehydrogenase